MIKLTDLFEDITVRPKRVLLFKIPVTLADGDNLEKLSAEIEYYSGVSISPQALLPDLNLYAKYPIVKFWEVVAEIQVDTDKFDDVRCVCCIPEFSDDPYKGLPDGLSFDATVYNQTGFCYVSFKSAGNIELNDVEKLVTILPFERGPLNTVQDAANYLLFKSN